MIFNEDKDMIKLGVRRNCLRNVEDTDLRR